MSLTFDYAESLRDRKRTGALTEQQVNAMADDRNAKFEFEVDNMFKANHRILYGQVSAFVPFCLRTVVHHRS